MDYRAIYTDDEIEHGLFGRKGSEKKNHKYLLREWVNGKWKYYYTQAQIAARKLGNKLSGKNEKSKSKLTNARLMTPKEVGNELKKNFTADTKKISKAVGEGKKAVSRWLKKMSKTTTVKQLMGKSTEKTSLLTKGKNVVNNLFKEKVKSNPLNGFGVGLTNQAYAKSFGSLAVSDLFKGKFSKAANEASVAVDYLTSDSKSSRIKKNKVVDKLGLELRGANPEWHDGFVSFADIAEYNRKKKK